MQKELQFAQEMVKELWGLQISVFDITADTQQGDVRRSIYQTLLPIVSDGEAKTFLASMESGCIYEISGALGLCYLLIPMEGKRRFVSVGPGMLNEFSEGDIRRQLQGFRLPPDRVDSLVSYCRWQPVVSRERFRQIGGVLARYLLDLPQPAPYRQLLFPWDRVRMQQNIVPDLYAEQTQIRQVEKRYEAANAMIEAVKEGNLSLAMHFIRGIMADMAPVVRSHTLLRNIQNYCIILNTQLRHAMEEKNIHPYQLDIFSSDIAQHIERLDTTEAAAKYCMEIIRLYCELVLQDTYLPLHPLAKQAVVYIKTHLTDALSVKATARALGVNANYLSGLFRRETGTTFTEYVNRHRVRQAAALLRRTTMQVQEVASAVGYNNTSYFGTQFAAVYGMTPSAYRNSPAAWQQ